jgi:hypothetical protein
LPEVDRASGFLVKDMALADVLAANRHGLQRRRGRVLAPEQTEGRVYRVDPARPADVRFLLGHPYPYQTPGISLLRTR